MVVGYKNGSWIYFKFIYILMLDYINKLNLVLKRMNIKLIETMN